MFTGYGRGWSEERAKTRIGRFMQRLRAPATTTTYIWALAIAVIALVLIPLVIAYVTQR